MMPPEHFGRLFVLKKGEIAGRAEPVGERRAVRSRVVRSRTDRFLVLLLCLMFGTACGRGAAAQSTGAQSEAVQSTGMQSEAVQSTGAQSEAAQSTGAQSEAVQSTGVQSEVAQSTAMQGAKLEDGVYPVEVTLSGGSGRASLQTPTELTVQDGVMTVLLIWNSSHYDYMLVDGKKYMGEVKEEHSVFHIPIQTLQEPLSVTADTTAMSRPHEIEYTLSFRREEGKAPKACEAEYGTPGAGQAAGEAEVPRVDGSEADEQTADLSSKDAGKKAVPSAFEVNSREQTEEEKQVN